MYQNLYIYKNDIMHSYIDSVDNNLSELGKLSIKQLMEFKGIGEAKAITIAAALELGRRRRGEEALEKKKITSSASVFELMQPVLGDLPHEEFWIIYLNNSNKVIQKNQLSKGGITGTLVDVRLVLKNALVVGATGLILAHNHPSGTLKPSEADKQITQKIKMKKVLLTGISGYIGLHCAVELLKKGYSVTLLDVFGPGNSRASSGGDSRVIRGIYGEDKIYVDLVARSFKLWKRYQKQWHQSLYFPTGALWFFQIDDTYAKKSLPIVNDAGLKSEELSIAEVEKRYPQINLSGIKSFYYEQANITHSSFF